MPCKTCHLCRILSIRQHPSPRLSHIYFMLCTQLSLIRLSCQLHAPTSNSVADKLSPSVAQQRWLAKTYRSCRSYLQTTLIDAVSPEESLCNNDAATQGDGAADTEIRLPPMLPPCGLMLTRPGETAMSAGAMFRPWGLTLTPTGDTEMSVCTHTYITG